MAETIFFYLFAIGAIAGTLGVVAFKQPINSAISLVVAFFFLAGVYILLNAEFMAIIQVMVYAGAIMVLFLFVLMLLNVRDEDIGPARYSVHTILGIFMTLAVLATLVASVLAALDGGRRVSVDSMADDFGTIEPMGHQLMTSFVLPFELASVLLPVGIVGAVVVAKRRA